MRNFIKKILDKLWDTPVYCEHEKIWERIEKPFEKQSVVVSDSKIADSYAFDNKAWPHIEYIYKLTRPAILEPDSSIAICGVNTIVPQTTTSKGSLPSMPRYIKSRLSAKTHYPKAVLFDGVLGSNYFHFFTDVINKIWLLPKIKGYETLPFIINAASYKRKYFQYILNNTVLKHYNWVVQQPGQYISVDELYLLHPMPYDVQHFGKLKAMLGVEEKPNAGRRLFLTRNAKNGRYLNNMASIQLILDKYGFDIVDTDGLDLQSQIDLFADTRYLIALHGAGNTNILFSPKDLSMLEINPDGRIACQYYWLATSLGINYYDAISGSKLDNNNSYELDATKLETAIQQLLSS